MKTLRRKGRLYPIGNTHARTESMADFKHRIALLMRNKEGGKVYSIIGAARPDPCVVRPKKEIAHPKRDGILQP